jgi:hypothetical protein
MKKAILSVAALLLMALPAFVQAAAADPAVEAKIAANEKALWDAWKNHDAKPFNEYLSDDAVNIAGGEMQKGKAATVKDISSTDCKVNDFSLSDFSYTWLDHDTVIVTYIATQDAECKGQKLPTKVIASSAWSKKQSKWESPFHQETPAMPAM